MTYLLRTTALIAAVATGATAVSAATPVEKIDVEANVSAIQNQEAAKVWNNLEKDLEAALAARLVDQLDPENEEAAEIEIEIEDVALASGLDASLGLENSTLMGDVKVDLPDSQYDQRYDLTVTAEQAVAYYPDGTDATALTVNSDVFYTAMIDAFADHVAQKLQ